MRFTETTLPGAFLVELDQWVDDRGFFARSWCRREFAARGLNADFVQCNIGFSRHAGTLRGIHLQLAPHAEAKLVRCCRGSIHDVVVDLRPGSPTFRQWIGTELTADNHRMLYVPEGFGHGYQTLEDDTEIVYQTSEYYHAAHATGVRYDDPAFAFRWPLTVTRISDADRRWPSFDPGTWTGANVEPAGGAP
ncbi:MAG: dTDP-4-dehydrorhamnose 3,5-epimerase [Planctomycetes bacterium]|nr:dTDP-4-dehydrorhamnose 3,5-epimerase [Planctomycetota bacterium]